MMAILSWGQRIPGRTKSFPVQDDVHRFTESRCVERNAPRAGLVDRAEEWRWGFVYRWLQKPRLKTALLSQWDASSQWPVARLPV